MVLATMTVVEETVGDTVRVEDSTTTEPCDVTMLDVTNVDVDTADDLWLEAEDATETTLLALLPPVDRLTCLFSCRANAASISCAGIVVAEMIAKSRNVGNDHGCILKDESEDR